MTSRPSDDLIELLACPCDGEAVSYKDGALHCPNGHSFACVEGIPIMLNPDVPQTTRAAEASLRVRDESSGPLYLETIALRDELRQRIATRWKPDAPVDEVSNTLIAATSGLAYHGTSGKAQIYPIPSIPLPPGDGKQMLDIGCSWGRWSVSAARRGWRVVGIDPSLGALAAARRAFGNEGHDLQFVCGDARHLPFRKGAFHLVFSYSVLQHFSKPDARLAFGQIGRVLKRRGSAKLQLAHSGGLRSMYHRFRRTDANHPFRVRYWTIPEVVEAIEAGIGPTKISAEAFGGLGLLPEDRSYLSVQGKRLVDLSQRLKRLSTRFSGLVKFADSIYVDAERTGG